MKNKTGYDQFIPTYYGSVRINNLKCIMMEIGLGNEEWKRITKVEMETVEKEVAL